MDVLYAADWGVVPGDDPLLCEKLIRMLQDVQEKQGAVIQFAPGAYHFYPDSAPKRAYHISNHNQDGVWPTAFLLEKNPPPHHRRRRRRIHFSCGAAARLSHGLR